MTRSKEDLSKIMERIRKLLALGTSSNKHESALAVAKAQELLQQYDLTMESIDNLKADSRTSIRDGSRVVSTTSGKPDGWKAELFEAVAETSDCFTAYATEWEYTKSGRGRQVRHGYMIGFAHDVEVAGYELAFLVGEIERLAQEYAQSLWDDIKKMAEEDMIPHTEAESRYVQRTGRHPLKAKLYFIRGCTSTVTTSLKRSKYERDRAPSTTGTSLVVQKKKSVEDFIYVKKYGKTKEQFVADRQAEWDRWQAEHLMNPTPQETEAQRRAREKRQDAQWARQDRSRAAREAREYAETDHSAVAAGRERGREIQIRKGITEGEADNARLDR